MAELVTSDPLRRPARGRLRPVVALAICVLVLASAACSSAAGPTASGSSTSPPPAAPGTTPTQAPARTVAIVGDSITQQGEDVLRRDLSERWELAIDGRPGFTIAEQTPAAVVLAAESPAQMIVNLGTNDVLRGFPTEEIDADLRALLAAVEGVPCIHLVTIAEEMIVQGGRSRRDGAVAANEVLARLVAGDPRLRLVDWAAELRAADEALLYDTVHPNTTGQERLAALYDEALEGGCAA